LSKAVWTAGSGHIAVHKSPSLTVAESWLSIVVFTVVVAVFNTICFR
jgi:hypothetical protein